MISYLFLLVGGFSTWLFSTLFLKLEINDQDNVPLETGLLLVANHQTLADSFFIGTFYIQFILQARKPRFIIWNTPEFTNFFKTPILKKIFENLRCLPVTRNGMGRNDFREFFDKVKTILQSGNLLIFFEGTRTRTGEIGEARSGVAKIIQSKYPKKVIPVKISDFSQVMPVGARGFRVGFPFLNRKRVSITFGKPLKFDDLTGKPAEVRTAICERIRTTVINL